MSYDLVYIELKDALTEEGCALCRLRERFGRSYLGWLLHEQVNDMATRIKLAQSWGFCAPHAWLLQEMEWERDKDGMGTAILSEWLIGRYRTILQRYLDAPKVPKKRLFQRWPWRRRSCPADPLLQTLVPPGQCPACVSQQESELYTLQVLAYYLAADDSFRTLYKRSMGLCMPHFKVALHVAEDKSVVKLLVEVQLDKLAHMAGELGKYLRKHDYVLAHESYGSEADAFIRATELLVGKNPQTGAHEGSLSHTSAESGRG
jgi:hypothetical protein